MVELVSIFFLGFASGVLFMYALTPGISGMVDDEPTEHGGRPL